MEPPLFSICVIARNEAVTLPRRLLPSVAHFIAAGGEVVLLDTGSTDDTAQIARTAGCIVHEVGDRFVVPLPPTLLHDINTRFVVTDESPVLTADSRIFDFAAARNHADTLATNDMVLIVGCDEVFTALDISACNDLIRAGHRRIDVPFVHSHDAFGQPSLQFHRNSFYDRRVCRWTCVVHEVVTGGPPPFYADPTVIKVEHYQETNENRRSYLPGLAYDCYLNPDKDRQSHYFAREMMYYGRYRSAIHEFTRHTLLPNAWRAEQAQSMLFIGDCHLNLGDEKAAITAWHDSFLMDGTRREPMMRLATYFYRKADHAKSCAYAAAALAIPGARFYSNQMEYYRHLPHEILYVGQWWLGDKQTSRRHWQKALELCPSHQKYQDDAQFFQACGADRAA